MTLAIERSGQSGAPRGGLSADEVARIVKEMSGERDATIFVQPNGLDERLLVAVDKTRAFIGRERPDGLFQFARRDAGSTTTSFTIGGQEARLGESQPNHRAPDLGAGRAPSVAMSRYVDGSTPCVPRP